MNDPIEEDIFRRFYRGESIVESAMTAQYVATALKRHAERTDLDPEAYSARSLGVDFIMQVIRAGKAGRRVKEHSGTRAGRRSTSASRKR